MPAVLSCSHRSVLLLSQTLPCLTLCTLSLPRYIQPLKARLAIVVALAKSPSIWLISSGRSHERRGYPSNQQHDLEDTQFLDVLSLCVDAAVKARAAR